MGSVPAAAPTTKSGVPEPCAHCTRGSSSGVTAQSAHTHTHTHKRGVSTTLFVGATTLLVADQKPILIALTATPRTGGKYACMEGRSKPSYSASTLIHMFNHDRYGRACKQSKLARSVPIVLSDCRLLMQAKPIIRRAACRGAALALVQYCLLELNGADAHTQAQSVRERHASRMGLFEDLT
jgi:hypothetical protein